MTPGRKLFNELVDLCETEGGSGHTLNANLKLMFGKRVKSVIDNEPKEWATALYWPNYDHISTALHAIKLPKAAKKLLLDIAVPRVDDIVAHMKGWQNPSRELLEDRLKAFCRPLVTAHRQAQEQRKEDAKKVWKARTKK